MGQCVTYKTVCTSVYKSYNIPIHKKTDRYLRYLIYLGYLFFYNYFCSILLSGSVRPEAEQENYKEKEEG